MGTTIGSGGGGGRGRGTTDYDKLKNKPSINGQELKGNMELQGSITPEQYAAVEQATEMRGELTELVSHVGEYRKEYVKQNVDISFPIYNTYGLEIGSTYKVAYTSAQGAASFKFNVSKGDVILIKGGPSAYGRNLYILVDADSIVRQIGFISKKVTDKYVMVVAENDGIIYGDLMNYNSATDGVWLVKVESDGISGEVEDLFVKTEHLSNRGNEDGLGLVQVNSSYKDISSYGIFSKPNMIYDIVTDIEIDHDITIAKDCTLRFSGGRLVGGKVTGQSTKIEADDVCIFQDVNIAGTWDADGCPEWFGATGDGNADDTDAVGKAVNAFGRIHLNRRYKLTSVIIPDNKTVTIGGQIRSYGGGLIMQASTEDYASSVIGGKFITEPGSCAIQVVTNIVSNRRFTIKDCKIYGCKSNDYAIKGVVPVSSDSVYNAFGIIDNVSIYNCEFGIWGNFRVCRISATIEQCYYNLTIYGSLNQVNIIGQAGNRKYNSETKEYESTMRDLCFCFIEGTRNELNLSIYDVGSSQRPNYQKYIAYIDGEGNAFTNSDKIVSENSSYNKGHQSAKYPIANPIVEVANPNGLLINKASANVMLLQRRFYTVDRSFVPITNSGEDEKYIDFIFKNVTGFVGIEFECLSNNYEFSKLEILYDGVLISRYFTRGSRRYTTYDEFYNNNKTVNVLTVRAYVPANSEARLYRAKFYAMSASVLNVSGSSLERPHVSGLLSAYEFYDTTLNKPIWWNGSIWVDYNGEPADLQIIGKTSYIVSANGGESTIKYVKPSDAELQVESDKEWLTCVDDGRGTIVATATLNEGAPRTANVLLRCGELTKSVLILQLSNNQ